MAYDTPESNGCGSPCALNSQMAQLPLSLQWSEA
jgi:hypothetical protein